MMAVAAVALVVLAVLSLRGVRWAYIAFIVMGLAYFPVKVGFHFAPRACELLVGPRLALFSLTNYPHIVHFALFFVISSAQFSDARLSARASFARAALATLAMGALVELAEGVTGRGHCRLRDLIPDSAGIVVGVIAVLLWRATKERVLSRRNAA
jgi:hypothetical protein